MSVSDEIINLEPLEDKVNLLRQKYEMTTLDVLHSIKSRLNFFSVYQLFDTVSLNQIDIQRQQQKQWIHMKNFEQDLLVLSTKFERLETLSNLIADPEKLVKLEQILETVDVDELQEAIKAYRGGAAGNDTKIVEQADVVEEESPEQEIVESQPVLHRPGEQEEMQGDDDEARLSEVPPPRSSHKSRFASDGQHEGAASEHPSDYEDPQKKKRPKAKSKKRKDKRDGDDQENEGEDDGATTPNHESEKRKKNKKKSKSERKDDGEDEDGERSKRKKSSRTKNKDGESGDESGKRSKTEKKSKRKKGMTDDEENAD